MKKTNNIWKFIVPSLLGLMFFIVPIPMNGMTTVMFGHINNTVKSGNGINGVSTYDLILWFGLFAAILSAGLSILQMAMPKLEMWNTKFGKVFKTTSMGVLVRVIGAIVYYQVMVGVINDAHPLPEGHMFAWLTDEWTGGVIIGDFIGSVIVTFTIGTLILPLLLNFGLLEFIGKALSGITQAVFKVPGRAAIDAAASFVGDGTLGIVVTDEQYAKGNYTKRQAVTIATGFSVVGIAFTAFVAGELGFLSGLDFMKFYGTIIFTTVILAIIIPRTPIMKLYPDTYYQGQQGNATELTSDKPAIQLAAEKAEEGFKSLKEIYKNALISIVTIICTWIPVIIVVGSTALAFAEGYVYGIDLFGTISKPLIPLVELLQIPDAALVAEGIMISIADMYIPTLVIADSTSELAKFVVGTMSFITIIFFAETGVVLMKSKMKLNFLEVCMFFIIRVILALPIVALIGHLIIGG